MTRPPDGRRGRVGGTPPLSGPIVPGPIVPGPIVPGPVGTWLASADRALGRLPPLVALAVLLGPFSLASAAILALGAFAVAAR